MNNSGLKIRNYGSCWLTAKYADKGLTLIRLYKFKRKDIKATVQGDSDLTHYYMIAISINTANMFDGNADPHFSNNILFFTLDYVKAIYFHIFELIPCLEQAKEQYDRNSEMWLKFNSFNVHRIDFAFDLKTMHQQYLTLINRGYSLRKDAYIRSYYDNEEPDIPDNKETLSDEEPDIPDIEEVLKEIANNEPDLLGDKETKGKYSSDVNYIYFKSKSVNINIYHKQTEIEKEQLASNPNIDYDFLRIEVQVKKSKLHAIVEKFDLIDRELQCIAIPEVEQYILDYYVKALTGTGLYVTYDRAMKMIDESNYTKAKKERLKKVIEAVSKKHGIAKVLEQVEDGTITDLGKLSTVKQYLRDIHKDIKINPVTIPARMEVPKHLLKNQSGGKDLSERVLLSLVDILSAYGDQIKDYQLHGMPITDEEIEQIMKL